MQYDNSNFYQCFLLSMPRSGSTFLSRMLDRNTFLACPPESWLIIFFHHILNQDKKSPPFGINSCYLGAMGFLLEYEDIFLKFIKELSKNLEELYLLIPDTIPDPKNNINKKITELVILCFNKHLEKRNKNVFIDKTPRNYTKIEYIDKYFHDNKKIYLRRNPYDIAQSYMNTWGIDIDHLTGHTKTSEFSRDFSEGLLKLEKYFETPRPNHLIIDYEDLIKNNEECLFRICDFLSIPYQKEMIDFNQVNKDSQKFHNAFVGDFTANTNIPFIKNKNILNYNDKRKLDSFFNVNNSSVFSLIEFEKSKKREKSNFNINKLEEGPLPPLVSLIQSKIDPK